jgi:hypothetical protein
MRSSVGRSRGLASLQDWFFAQLEVGASRATGPVLGTPGLSARRRLDIYGDMYRARLIEALTQEFPRLQQALAPPTFERVALRYLERFPSRLPTIQDVGSRLPGFLRRELAAGGLRRFPFAADLARLERTGTEVYVSVDEEPGAERRRWTAADLAKRPPRGWPGLRFQVAPSLRIVRVAFRFPRHGRPVREKIAYRVYRRDLDVFEAPMDPVETRALSLIQRGRTFGDVCLALGEAATAATALATWVDEGLLLKSGASKH